MERMGVEYQRFDGKEYVSLRRYYNLLCKCKALEKENKNLKEKVRFLEECLDRKEKLNEGYREEIDLLKKGNLPSPGYPYGGGPIFC